VYSVTKKLHDFRCWWLYLAAPVHFVVLNDNTDTTLPGLKESPKLISYLSVKSQ